jgi:hypothetical protein
LPGIARARTSRRLRVNTWSRTNQVVGSGHVHVREPEAGSLGKQKVGLLAVVSVEITSPHDWPAMVCDLFTDRRQLAPERLEIEREFAGEVHPMRVGYK